MSKRKVVPFKEVAPPPSDLRKLDVKKVKLPREVLEGLMVGVGRVHLYDFDDVLRPRGHMKKESIGVTILEKLKDYYESWTDHSYSDNPIDRTLVLKTLQKNLREEYDGAWREFIRFINEKENIIA
jgi:hypothetical protein